MFLNSRGNKAAANLRLKNAEKKGCYRDGSGTASTDNGRPHHTPSCRSAYARGNSQVGFQLVTNGIQFYTSSLPTWLDIVRKSKKYEVTVNNNFIYVIVARRSLAPTLPGGIEKH